MCGTVSRQERMRTAAAALSTGRWAGNAASSSAPPRLGSTSIVVVQIPCAGTTTRNDRVRDAASAPGAEMRTPRRTPSCSSQNCRSLPAAL